MFKNPSFLFDILCTVVWLVLMARYARKGFLASIVQLSGNLISLLGARQCSAACAGWVFENLLAGGFRTQIAAHLSEDGVVNLSGIAQQYAGFLPESFRASIVAACERSINAVLADNAVVRRGVRCGRRRAGTLRPWRRQSCQRFAGRCKRRPAARKRTGVHRRTAG